jgi:hypothetical protein
LAASHTEYLAASPRKELFEGPSSLAKYAVTARHCIKHAYLAETRQALDA